MTDERIIAYLLEDLPEEERERFEDECFASESLQEQVTLVEGELIDDYLQDALTPEQRRSFEQNYLTTAARIERVRLAAALLRLVDGHPPAPDAKAAMPPVKRSLVTSLRAWWGSRVPRAAVALAVVAIVVGGWWYFRAPETRTPPATFASLTLTLASGDRAEGAEAGRVRLTGGVDALRLSLNLPGQGEPAASYRVQLEDDNGAVKLSENAAPEARTLRLTIPASRLAPGRYVLKLFAIRPDGTEQRIPGGYFFTVE